MTRRGVLPALVAAILSGCATPLELPTASSGPSDLHGMLASLAGSPAEGVGSSFSGRFYPLQIDNHWLFHKQVITAIVPNEGDPSPPYVEDRFVDHRLICVEPRDGRDYTVDQVDDTGPNGVDRAWIRLRQDRTGLYEADVPLQEPPPCAIDAPAVARHVGGATADIDAIVSRLAPGGYPSRQAAVRSAIERLRARLAIAVALGRSAGASSTTGSAATAAAGELTRLRYPLRVGAHWVVRTGPGIAFTANIEAADVLDLGVGRLRGFRIRLRSEAFGPTDVVRVWYGPSGYLQLESHLQADAVDVFGQVVGRVIVDDKETLVFVQVPQPAFVFEPKIGGRLSADTTGGGRH
jgi:hypothetical protein